MKGVELGSVTTNAGYRDGTDQVIQWAEIKIRIEEGFDWKVDGPKLLKKLQQATELIGKGSEAAI